MDVYDGLQIIQWLVIILFAASILYCCIGSFILPLITKSKRPEANELDDLVSPQASSTNPLRRSLEQVDKILPPYQPAYPPPTYQPTFVQLDRQNHQEQHPVQRADQLPCSSRHPEPVVDEVTPTQSANLPRSQSYDVHILAAYFDRVSSDVDTYQDIYDNYK